MAVDLERDPRAAKMDVGQAQTHRSLTRPVLLGGAEGGAGDRQRDEHARRRTGTGLAVAEHTSRDLSG